MKKVIIVQRIIPHYRIEFFELLYNKCIKEDINIKIVHSTVEIENNEVFKYIKPTFEMNIKSLLNEKLVLSFGLYKYLKNANPHLILTEDISNLPNGLLIFLFSKIYKIRYGILGLGRILSKKDSILKKILKFPIEIFRNGASFFISYSLTGAKYYQEKYSKKSISWNNSVCNSQIITKEKFLVKYERNEFNILFIGRIEKFKRLDLLIDSLVKLNKKNIKLYVIGNGPELENLKVRYKDLNFISWLGKITNKTEKEKYFNITHLCVMPGSGGLVIQELQSYGIPVIASYSDGTEVDLIKNVNPELFVENMSLNNLTYTIQKFYSLNIDEKADISMKSHTVTSKEYNLNNMTEITKKLIKEEII